MFVFITVITYTLYILTIVYAVTLHEVSHGLMAKFRGDDTATKLGRLSMNPIKHVDPIGTVIVPMILLFIVGFPFGWAKPVPVDRDKLKNPRIDMALVGAAGPIANLFMLIFWSLVFKYAADMNSDSWLISQVLINISKIGILINFVVMMLNLIPIPPLDGSRVMLVLIPESWEKYYYRFEPYGIILVFFIVLTLVKTNILLPTEQEIVYFIISIISKF